MYELNTIKKIEAVDYSVIDEISTLKHEEAFPVIEKGLVHSNADVRELSVLALETRPEDKAVDLMIKSIVDEDMSVQMAAISAVAKRPSKRIVPSLKQAFDEVDPDIQAEIVLLLGMCGDISQKEYLQHVFMKAQSENESELSKNSNLALARLGDVDARNRIMINFSSEQVEDRRDALDDMEYINDAKLLVQSKFLLNDTEIAMDIGLSPSHEYLRICDLFVISANAILGHPFSFAECGRQFTEDELQYVALYIDQHSENK